MAIIKAGTYLFNDVLTAIGNCEGHYIEYSFTTEIPGYGEVTAFGVMIDQLYEDSVDIAFTVTISELGVVNNRTCLYSNGWNTNMYGEGIKTVTIPYDQEVSDEFNAWFTSNATIQGEAPLVKVTYNGETIIQLYGGQRATVKCKGDAITMLSDILIEVAEEKAIGIVDVRIEEV